VRIIENPVNRGFAEPSTRGASEAKGRIVAFINNDMRADSRWLTAALPHLGDSSPCVASRILDWSGERIDFNGSSLQYLGYAAQQDIGELASQVKHDDRILFPCGGAMLMERRVFLEVGGFDPDYFALFEDVDLGWRLWLAGHEVAFAPDSVVFHRGHATLERHANEKMRYLLHRNALLTILKGYEEENFRRIFPLAIFAAIKRAVILSGVNRELFHMWGRTVSRLEAGDHAAHVQILDALNHLVGVDDILENLPLWLEKRRQVQAMRRRTDAEIVALFNDPLRCIVDDPTYVAQEIQHLENLGLDALFATSSYKGKLAALPHQLQDRIINLRQELRGLQWLEGYALSHPRSTLPAERWWRRLLRVLRSEGMRGVWTRAVQRLKHAV
jgi:GT2 family glycosyltransferase